MRRTALTLTIALTMLVALAPGASATWSFVVVDPQTGEIGVGSVTCVANVDLRAVVPVVITGVGAAAVQAAADFDGIRRPIIHEELLAGTAPRDILLLLAQVPGHQQRQYGIVDTLGRAATFTGGQNFPWAGGVTGEADGFVYAIQGNILAGSCVVPAIEAAIRDTPGDMAARMMAAHVAARDAGGDGRCSCSPVNPTGCGCPPPDFQKSGHIGFLLVARIGDPDDPLCDRLGCADGDYYLNLNVPFQGGSDPDPVVQLQELFDTWRAGLPGRPDAVRSTASFDKGVLPPTGSGQATLTFEIRDFEGNPVAGPFASVSVVHAPDSARLTSIGPVQPLGGGRFRVTVTQKGPGGASFEGIDRFHVIVDDGIRPVTLMPVPELRIRRVDQPVKR